MINKVLILILLSASTNSLFCMDIHQKRFDSLSLIQMAQVLGYTIDPHTADTSVTYGLPNEGKTPILLYKGLTPVVIGDIVREGGNTYFRNIQVNPEFAGHKLSPQDCNEAKRLFEQKYTSIKPQLSK